MVVPEKVKGKDIVQELKKVCDTFVTYLQRISDGGKKKSISNKLIRKREEALKRKLLIKKLIKKRQAEVEEGRSENEGEDRRVCEEFSEEKKTAPTEKKNEVQLAAAEKEKTIQMRKTAKEELNKQLAEEKKERNLIRNKKKKLTAMRAVTDEKRKRIQFFKEKRREQQRKFKKQQAEKRALAKQLKKEQAERDRIMREEEERNRIMQEEEERNRIMQEKERIRIMEEKERVRVDNLMGTVANNLAEHEAREKERLKAEEDERERLRIQAEIARLLPLKRKMQAEFRRKSILGVIETEQVSECSLYQSNHLATNEMERTLQYEVKLLQKMVMEELLSESSHERLKHDARSSLAFNRAFHCPQRLCCPTRMSGRFHNEKVEDRNGILKYAIPKMPSDSVEGILEEYLATQTETMTYGVKKVICRKLIDIYDKVATMFLLNSEALLHNNVCAMFPYKRLSQIYGDRQLTRFCLGLPVEYCAARPFLNDVLFSVLCYADERWEYTGIE